MDIGGLVLVEVLAGPQVTMIGIIPVRVTNTNAKALCFCATFYHVPCSPWVSKMIVWRLLVADGRIFRPTHHTRQTPFFGTRGEVIQIFVNAYSLFTLYWGNDYTILLHSRLKFELDPWSRTVSNLGFVKLCSSTMQY